MPLETQHCPVCSGALEVPRDRDLICPHCLIHLTVGRQGGCTTLSPSRGSRLAVWIRIPAGIAALAASVAVPYLQGAPGIGDPLLGRPDWPARAVWTALQFLLAFLGTRLIHPRFILTRAKYRNPQPEFWMFAAGALCLLAFGALASRKLMAPSLSLSSREEMLIPILLALGVNLCFRGDGKTNSMF